MAHTQQLINTFSFNLTHHCGIPAGSRGIVCVSGGSDSVALLLLLLELRQSLNLELHVLHFNHGLRPESLEEQQFIEQLAQKHNIPCTVKVSDKLILKKTALQEQARTWRLQEAQILRKILQADWIATAHHQQDQLETLLMKWLRGVHLSHFSGMAWSRDHQIRPLLNISKQELQDYLKDRHQAWQEDTSNQSSKYHRNRVRLELLPLLNELARENLDARLQDMSEQSQQLKELLESLPVPAGLSMEALSWNLEEWHTLPVLQRDHLLHQWILIRTGEHLTYAKLKLIQRELFTDRISNEHQLSSHWRLLRQNRTLSLL
ncbi:MAG: tRNA lysidine(34) synthetase TilS, partial [SAR324 cluster bacterium]|nr:tRNA lysidine(34) synthetase TilS [SAR324 cluster bacterium]